MVFDLVCECGFLLFAFDAALWFGCFSECFQLCACKFDLDFLVWDLRGCCLRNCLFVLLELDGVYCSDDFRLPGGFGLC